jgi:tRNA/rRNA methyltransferase
MNRKTEIVFILVEPAYRGNIGAAARVINNFGFSQLRLVGAVPQKEDHYLAFHSEEIMKSIEVFDDLNSALQDTGVAIALTRRSGRKKKTDLEVRELREFIIGLPRGKTALVFGREAYGLKDDEIALCPIRCEIPTDEGFGSLNLAQAVAIVAYELFRANRQDNPKGKLAEQSSIDKSVGRIIRMLTSIGYFKTGEPKKVEKRLQSILLRNYTGDEDLRFLDRMFQRIEILFSGRE